MINEPSITTMQSERLGAEPIASHQLDSPHTTTPSPLTLFERTRNAVRRYKTPDGAGAISRKSFEERSVRPSALRPSITEIGMLKLKWDYVKEAQDSVWCYRFKTSQREVLSRE
jgi:hypothetical protein